MTRQIEAKARMLNIIKDMDSDRLLRNMKVNNFCDFAKLSNNTKISSDFMLQLEQMRNIAISSDNYLRDNFLKPICTLISNEDVTVCDMIINYYEKCIR